MDVNLIDAILNSNYIRNGIYIHTVGANTLTLKAEKAFNFLFYVKKKEALLEQI